MTALLLAAGLGTRLRPLTLRYPKCALPLLNVPLLFYPLGLLKTAGAHTLIVNTHYLPDQIEALAPLIREKGFLLSFSHEKEKILGSGGAVRFADNVVLGDDFFLVNGDEVLLAESKALSNLIEVRRNSNSLATLLVMDHPGVGTQFGGVWADGEGIVRGFGKSAPGAGLKGWHFTGFQFISKKIHMYLPKGESNIFYDVMVNAIKAGETIRIVKTLGPWFETGNHSDFLKTTKELIEILVRDPSGSLSRFLSNEWKGPTSRASFWEGTNCELHSPVVRPGVLLGNSVRIGPAVKMKGFCVIGDGAEVGEGVQLENVILAPGVAVSPGSSHANTYLV